MDTQIVKLIEEGKLLEAQDLLKEALTDKAAELLVEKRKQIVAKTFKGKKPAVKSTGKDEKTILKSSQRKALKDKMGKLKRVKK